MYRTLFAVLLCAVFCQFLSVLNAGGFGDADIFLRGDSNSDGRVDNSDIITISNYLFNGGTAPPCLNQADVNDDGFVDSSDSIYLANWLYSGGAIPPAPGPFADSCSKDTGLYPGCEESPCPLVSQ